MTRRGVAITGTGLVSPLGDSARELLAALLAGERGVRPVEGLGIEALPSQLGGAIPGFSPDLYLGKANFRPLDRTGQLTVAAAALALEASGWDEDARRAEEVGLVLGTMFGSVRTIAEFDRRALTAGPNYVKPFDFANSVINAAAGQAAIWHDLRGPNATLSGGTGAGLQAIAYAADLVAGARAAAVLAGGADELCFESFFGFARAGMLCASNGVGGPPHPVPYAARRNGIAPAEGAALLVLETLDRAEARGAPVLGVILGHGAAFDPSRGSDAAAGATAVERAVRAALAAAGIAAEDLGFVATGASGSVALDAREADGIVRALGEAARELPVTAVKSGVGESLGAGGALQAILAVTALAGGALPGVVGLDETDPAIPLRGLSQEPRAIDRRPALVTALDRHGGAHALVLASGEGIER